MKKTIPIILAVLLLSVTLLCGCSARSFGVGQSDSSAKEAEAYYPGSAAFDAKDPAESAPSDVTAVLSGRKIIRNAELSVEALDFDSFIRSMNERVRAYGGYIQSNYVDSSDYSSGRLRTAETVVRIPAEKLDDFLSDVNGAGNVTRQQEDVADVTDNYIDTEARLSSLRTEYNTLLGLLERAENLDEIIQLQDRLTNVRGQIESYEAKLRSYDNSIDFSTVTMHIREVEQETVVTEESFGEETSRRFNESLNEVGDGFKSFAKWFIGNLPHIVVALLFIALTLFIVFFSIKKTKKHNARIAAERGAKVQQTVVQTAPAPRQDSVSEPESK